MRLEIPIGSPLTGALQSKRFSINKPVGELNRAHWQYCYSESIRENRDVTKIV